MNALSELVTLSLKKNVSEAVIQRCSAKKVFLEISQNSQERLWHRRFSCKFCEFLRTFFTIEHLRGLLLMVFRLDYLTKIRTKFLKQLLDVF